jgi:superfamily II DNA or RNA helicase
VIFVDEFHHASAKQYRDVFKHCAHVFYRYGMTGTFFRSGVARAPVCRPLRGVGTGLQLDARG